MAVLIVSVSTGIVSVAMGYWVGYRDGLHCRLCTKHVAKGHKHHQIVKRHKTIHA